MKGIVSALAAERERHAYVRNDKQNVAIPGELYELAVDCTVVRGEIDALEPIKNGSVEKGTVAVFLKLERVSERSAKAKRIWALRQVFLIEGLQLVVYDSRILTKKV